MGVDTLVGCEQRWRYRSCKACAHCYIYTTHDALNEPGSTFARATRSLRVRIRTCAFEHANPNNAQLLPRSTYQSFVSLYKSTCGSCSGGGGIRSLRFFGGTLAFAHVLVRIRARTLTVRTMRHRSNGGEDPQQVSPPVHGG